MFLKGTTMRTLIIIASIIIAVFAIMKLLPKSSKAAKVKAVDLKDKAKAAVIKGREDLDNWVESKLVA